MGAVITLEGIDQAISNLDYQNRNALKSRLILLIRDYYTDDESVAHLNRIGTQELIQTLWETGDDIKEIKRRRKNFNSVKSSLNMDLQRLFEAGKNPEGVSVGPDNIFVMSEEAKDKILRDYGLFMMDEGTDALTRILSSLKYIEELLGDKGQLAENEGNGKDSGLDRLREMIIHLAGTVGLDISAGPSISAGEGGNDGSVNVVAGADKSPIEPQDLEKGPGQEEITDDVEADEETEITDEAETVEEWIDEDELEGQTGADDTDPGDGDLEVDLLEESEGPDQEEVVEEVDDEDVEDVLSMDEDAGNVVDEESITSEETWVNAEEEGDDLGVDEEILLADDEDIPSEEIDEDAFEMDEDDEGGEIIEIDDPEAPEILEEAGADDSMAGVEDAEELVLEPEDAEDIPVEEVMTEEPGLSEDVEDEVIEDDILEDAEEILAADDVDEAPAEDAEDIPVEEVMTEEPGLSEDVEDEDIDDDILEDAEETLADDDVDEAPVEVVEDDDFEEIADTDGVEDAEISGGPDSGNDPGDGGNPETDDWLEADDLEALEADDLEADDLKADELESDDLVMEGEPEATGEGLGSDFFDGNEDVDVDKARRLAEEFNQFLGSMDRFYNQYLLIPGGQYPVGPNGDLPAGRHRSPVTLPAFYFGKFPVTNALFGIFVEKTGYRTDAEKQGYGMVFFGRYKECIDEETGERTLNWNSALISENVEGACWFQPCGPGSSVHQKRNHPVVQVTLNDAMAFAAWTGKRLPSEDEWEAASRTTSGCIYPWGNDWQIAACNMEASCIGDTTPVDRYIQYANELGIVDAVGNVWEWTLDRNVHYGEKDREKSMTYKVKGGCWASGDAVPLFHSDIMDPKACSNIISFRCVAC